MKRLLVAFAVLAVILIALVWWYSGGLEPRHDANGAKTACRDFVKQQLIAPATAQFPLEMLSPYSRCDVCYDIIGAVDSQNTFGALLRRNYVCRVRYRSALHGWSLDGIDWKDG